MSPHRARKVVVVLPAYNAEKTLEAWVQLSDLQQRGGGVLGVQTLDGSVFDAIVFGALVIGFAFRLRKHKTA